MYMRPVRKYILIPEYAPLWAMQQCFGPPNGPLKQPTLTPVDIIGHLLKQSGREKITIYEVVKTATGFSDPILLTLDNYKLSYEEIVAISSHESIDDIPPVVPDIPAVTPELDETDMVSDDQEVDDVEVNKVEEDPLDKLAHTAQEAFGEDAVIENEPVNNHEYQAPADSTVYLSDAASDSYLNTEEDDGEADSVVVDVPQSESEEVEDEVPQRNLMTRPQQNKSNSKNRNTKHKK